MHTYDIWSARLICNAEQAISQEENRAQMFLSEHARQLVDIEDALDDSLGEAWDFFLDPINIQVISITTQTSPCLLLIARYTTDTLTAQTPPYDGTTLMELVRSDHKVVDKGSVCEPGVHAVMRRAWGRRCSCLRR